MLVDGQCSTRRLTIGTRVVPRWRRAPSADRPRARGGHPDEQTRATSRSRRSRHRLWHLRPGRIQRNPRTQSTRTVRLQVVQQAPGRIHSSQHVDLLVGGHGYPEERPERSSHAFIGGSDLRSRWRRTQRAIVRFRLALWRGVLRSSIRSDPSLPKGRTGGPEPHLPQGGCAWSRLLQVRYTRDLSAEFHDLATDTDCPVPSCTVSPGRSRRWPFSRSRQPCLRHR